jgi:hypothetical protein
MDFFIEENNNIILMYINSILGTEKLLADTYTRKVC